VLAYNSRLQPTRVSTALLFLIMSLVKPTTTPAIKNAPILGLAEGNGSFSNLHLAALVLGVPYVLKRILPIVSRGGFKTYVFLVIVTGIPVTIAYWTYMSQRPDRKNFKVNLPGRNIEHYITIKDPELKELYNGKKKIPMQVFHDAYFEGKIDFNEDLMGGMCTTFPSPLAANTRVCFR
jgi:sphingolipid C9-methyltransferase